MYFLSYLTVLVSNESLHSFTNELIRYLFGEQINAHIIESLIFASKALIILKDFIFKTLLVL